MSAKKSRDELIKGEPSFIGFVDMSDHSRKVSHVLACFIQSALQRPSKGATMMSKGDRRQRQPAHMWRGPPAGPGGSRKNMTPASFSCYLLSVM